MSKLIQARWLTRFCSPSEPVAIMAMFMMSSSLWTGFATACEGSRVEGNGLIRGKHVQTLPTHDLSFHFQASISLARVLPFSFQPSLKRTLISAASSLDAFCSPRCSAIGLAPGDRA